VKGRRGVEFGEDEEGEEGGEEREFRERSGGLEEGGRIEGG